MEQTDEPIKIFMSKEEVETILSYLRPTDIVLEWGAGGSTQFFSQFVKEYHSIEHDKEWYDKLIKDVLPNVKLYYVPNNLERTNPTRRSQFKDYIEYVHKIGLKFDKVLIDGRARVYCALEVLPYLKKDSIIFFHDFYDRFHYWKILGLYKIIDSIRTLPSLSVMVKK